MSVQITLWTAEMFTAEETQIYIIPLDPPSAHWWIISSKLLVTLDWDNIHTKVICLTFLYHLMYKKGEKNCKMHSKITATLIVKRLSQSDSHHWLQHTHTHLHLHLHTHTHDWIPTLMGRRTLMGRLLEGGANKISLSVIGWPVYIVLLRKRKKMALSPQWEVFCTHFFLP